MTQELEQGTNATLVAVRNGPGARLRAAREAAGYTQLEIAQQLRLNPETIARLEEDNYDLTMPLVFVKGYLRSYAGLIGLDPEQIIIEFGHLGIKDPVRDVPDLGHSPQRKLSNFDAGTPKHRPGLLWGSLALFVCGMVAFMFAYRDQIPALNATEASATTTNTMTPSTEEAELNAAIEAARQANAQPTAPANTPGGAAVPIAPATSAAATTPATTATATTPAPTASTPAPTSASTAVPLKKAAPVAEQNSNDDGDEDEGRQVKPVSTNSVVVPVRKAAKNTHETMLF